MAAATQQDVQTAFERARQSILSNVITRNDVQVSVTQLRNIILQDIRDMHGENQQAMRQYQARQYQMTLKVTNMERQIAAMQQILLRILDQQTRAMNLLQG